MTLQEASRMSEKLEKDSKFTGKSTRGNKDHHYSTVTITKISDGIKDGEDSEKMLKWVKQLTKKKARQIKNIKGLNNKKIKNSVNRVHKRLLNILKRGL